MKAATFVLLAGFLSLWAGCSSPADTTGPLAVRPNRLEYAWPPDVHESQTQPEAASSRPDDRPRSSNAAGDAIRVGNLGLLPDSIGLWVVRRHLAVAERDRPRILRAELTVDGARQNAAPVIQAFASKLGWSELATFSVPADAKMATITGLIQSDGRRYSVTVAWASSENGWRQGEETISWASDAMSSEGRGRK
jgi:hypothetical protein